MYVHDDREVLTLIENLIQNTTPSHSKSSDPFWEKSETALLQALMLYLLHEAPPEEQNFSMVMEMIAAAEVHEDDDTYQSPLDILFERLEMREPTASPVSSTAFLNKRRAKPQNLSSSVWAFVWQHSICRPSPS